jgi:hypothetical protein
MGPPLRRPLTIVVVRADQLPRPYRSIGEPFKMFEAFADHHLAKAPKRPGKRLDTKVGIHTA